MDERTILRRAKEVLLERGWYQGGFAAGPTGEGAVCLAGACNAAASGNAYDLTVGQKVYHLLEAGIDGASIAIWNDHSARSIDEVIAVLDRAIGSLPPEVSPQEDNNVKELVA